MDSIKQICERSKWLQSLLPAPEILAFNDWTRPADRDRAVSWPDGSDIAQHVGLQRAAIKKTVTFNTDFAILIMSLIHF